MKNMKKILLILLVLLMGLTSLMLLLNEIGYTHQDIKKSTITLDDKGKKLSSSIKNTGTIKGVQTKKGGVTGTYDVESLKKVREDKASSNVWYMKMLTTLVWQLILAIGFSIGVSLAILIFNLLTSSKVKEWQEIKKGNFGVALILVALIIMTGVIIIGVA